MKIFMYSRKLLLKGENQLSHAERGFEVECAKVREVNDAGRVNEILLINKSGQMILLVDGEVLPELSNIVLNQV